MTTTDKNFQTWLTDQYHEQATAYRVALEREVAHTKRIFGEPLRPDVRRVLLQSLKEIEFPSLPKYPGDSTKENCLLIFKTTPAPNRHLILREVVESI